MIETDNCGPGDYAAVVEIYNHYVQTSPATFDVTPFSVGDRVPWFSQFSDDGPYRLLVARQDESVVGYCCSTQFKTRPAYDQTVEFTVYVAADAMGQGVGKLLYESLLEQISEAELHRVYASITLPNDASVRMHEALGFRQVGVCNEIGFKFDSYWDVALYEKAL